MEHNNIYLDDDLEKKTQQVQQGLEDGAQAGLALAAALDKARAAAKALASTSSKVKRVLSGFDEINRLGEKKKTSSGRKSSTQKTEVPAPEPEKEVTPQLQSVDIPSVPALIFEALGLFDALELIKGIKRELGNLWQQLVTFWQEVLVPLGAWAEAVLIPVMGYQLVQAFQAVTLAISNAEDFIARCWQKLYDGAVSIFQGIGQCFINARDKFLEFVTNLLSGNTQLGGSTEEMGQRIGGVAGLLITAWNGLKSAWDTVGGALKNGIAGACTAIAQALQGVLNFLQGGFTSGWRSGFSALAEPVRGIINSILGFLNTMLSGLGSALNAVVRAANKLKFTVPDWVPGIGGQTYGFSLKTVAMPQIPYLAQGAVLPANQPFLAVVGDQKHGTNIEAPLATIQEAVAAVMADHTAGNMAGHEATVAVLRQILEAVLGIDVSDAVIARAAQSYQLKSAVMRGGGF